MDERMLENIYQSISSQRVSPTCKRIARTLCSGLWPDDFDEPYSPSLADIQYLNDHVIRPCKHNVLCLKNIMLTVETGSYLAYLIKDSFVCAIFIGNIGDGELALIRKLKTYMEYHFSQCKIRFDRIESLANSLRKSFCHINFNDSAITVDSMRIILRVLKENIKENLEESYKFDYTLKWNQSFDINELGLDELLEYIESPQFTVHNTDYVGTIIKMSNYREVVKLHIIIHVDYNRIKTGDIKKFLNQNKDNKWLVEVNEHKTDCLLLTSMIDIFKELPMKFEINSTTKEFFGQEKLNEILQGLVKTHVTDLNIWISENTPENFEIIIDKIKNMKLQRLSLKNIAGIHLTFQTVDEPYAFSGLPYLSINRNELNHELTKKLVCQLEHSKLKKLSISNIYLVSPTLDCLIFMLLNGSNLTSLELKYCDINSEHVRIIAEALKNTKITSIDLTGSKIGNDGVKAIANVVAQTKLNSIIIKGDEINGDSVIKLLKSIQKTNITNCRMNYFYSTKKKYKAMAKILKDNEILLQFISTGEDKKIDEYLKRNNNSFDKAKLIIDKFQKGTILYHYKYKDYFKAYELFIDTDILWTNINDKEIIKLKLKNNIKDNYMKICGIINDKLEVNNGNWANEKNFSDLSTEIINMICSNLNLSDVIS